MTTSTITPTASVSQNDGQIHSLHRTPYTGVMVCSCGKLAEDCGQNDAKTIKAYNTQTGRWFVDGRGFVAECKYEGTLLDGAGAAVVKYSFLNVGMDIIRGAYGCDCDNCNALDIVS